MELKVTASSERSDQEQQAAYLQVAEKGRIAAKAAIRAERAAEEAEKMMSEAKEKIRKAEELRKEADERKMEARMAFEETCNVIFHNKFNIYFLMLYDFVSVY